MSMEHWCNDTDIRKPMFCGRGGGDCHNCHSTGLGSNPRLSSDRTVKCHVHRMGETTWQKLALKHNSAGKCQDDNQRAAGIATCSFCSFMWRSFWNWQRCRIYKIIRHTGNDTDSGKPESCPILGATLSTINPTWTDLGLNQGRRGKRPATASLSSAYRKIRK